MEIIDNPYINFVPPREAPVFTPNDEEFADSLAYIAKIKPLAEKYGICKIKPPKDWQPPFAVDVNKFRFVPRVQRLNELEAKSRIKLNFLDQLAKFWELQGSSLKIPHVERKPLDLYDLYKSVEKEGGMVIVSQERKWTKVAQAMGYDSGRGVGGTLKGHYERILYPYHLFKTGRSLEAANITINKEENNPADMDYKPHGIEAKMASGSYKRIPKMERKEFYKNKLDNVSDYSLPADAHYKSHDMESKMLFEGICGAELNESAVDYNKSPELKKLQFHDAGPKVSIPKSAEEEEVEEKTKVEVQKMKTQHKSNPGIYSDVDMYYCHTCGHGDGEELMLLCDGCNAAFHTYCLVPALADIPKGDWQCPKCIKVACSKPIDPYGFEQSKQEFSLQTFGEMADNFKSNYFHKPVHLVPCDVVEKEYWRLVNSLEEDVAVQYGADIHAMNQGSGFLTKATKDQFADYEEYMNSSWNLNNLPVHEASVLCHINADISGMKIPWCYVGMCFSSFCWHNEDHWSYSINYMHWGEPKTWYGVAGSDAVQFEEVMKASAQELFEDSPDLLHQLTTIMNPNILTSQGVQICRTNQHAGEFVVTFPRAYHAGFNQGYNFAEAVNFCPSDWLPIGRQCIEHYRELHRQCVFSHEELVCKMAADPENLDFEIAANTHADLLAIAENEKSLRKDLLDLGVTEAEMEAFELLPDDERQCCFCKTTCFLSAVTCPCSSDRLVCLYHVKHLCSCPPSKYCLRYRYTLDELPSMLSRLQKRVECYETWQRTVKSALEATGEHKVDVSELKAMLIDAEKKQFPDSELFQSLHNAVGKAMKFANAASQFVTRKARTRNRQKSDDKCISKLSLDELNCFYEQVSSLPCIIRERQLLKELLDQVFNFQSDAKEALEAMAPDTTKLDRLIEFGVALNIDLPEILKLKQALQQATWLNEVYEHLQGPEVVVLDTLCKLIESGVVLSPHNAVEKMMAELQELLTLSEQWEEKAKSCLQARPCHSMSLLEEVVNEALSIPVYLPNVNALKEALHTAKEWTTKVEEIQKAETYPYLDVLESVINKGRSIPVHLDQLSQIESQVAIAKSWRERTAHTFLKKKSTCSLLEVLSPRNNIGIYSNAKWKKKLKLTETQQSENNFPNINEEEKRKPALVVAAFKMAEEKEVKTMMELRIHNTEKVRNDSTDARFCVCRKRSSGFMLQCELCKDWFHGTCVPLPKSVNTKSTISQATVQAAKELKFLCPFCLRSCRPQLETVLSLLVSLQNLHVRLPEGEALKCLTERAIVWQGRAMQALAASGLASAVAKLSVISQKKVEQAAREKMEKEINSELLQAANNPELQGQTVSVMHNVLSVNGTAPIIRIDSGISVDFVTSMPSSSPATSDEDTRDDDEEDYELDIESVSCGEDSNSTPATGGGISEHAYSSMSKLNAARVASPKKHHRKSPLLQRQLENHTFELSDQVKVQLEMLMMEGDLLEVSLDEAQSIWHILQTCQLHSEDDQDYDSKTDYDSENMKIRKSKKTKKVKKKRKCGIEGFDSLKSKKVKVITMGLDGEKLKKKLKVMTPKIQKDNAIAIIEDIAHERTGPFTVDIKTNNLKKVKKQQNKVDKIRRKKTLKVKAEVSHLSEKKRKKRVEKEVALPDDDDDDDDDDDCAAMRCLKPTGEVNWVQCDHCEEWFHLQCVGLAEDEVSEVDEYACFSCKTSQGLTQNQVSSLYKPITSGLSVLKSTTDSDNMLCNEEVDVISDTPNVESYSNTIDIYDGSCNEVQDLGVSTKLTQSLCETDENSHSDKSSAGLIMPNPAVTPSPLP